MEKFDKLEGVAAPLRIVNVDTDMIIPKQYLKTLKRTAKKRGMATICIGGGLGGAMLVEAL